MKLGRFAMRNSVPLQDRVSSPPGAIGFRRSLMLRVLIGLVFAALMGLVCVAPAWAQEDEEKGKGGMTAGTPSCTTLSSVPTDTFFRTTVTCISPGRFGSSNLSV